MLRFLLFASLIAVACGTAQQDCAQLVYSKVTDFISTSQINQVLTVIGDDIYAQKPNANITDDAENKVMSVVSATQSASFLSMYQQCKSDLGNDFDKVVAQVTKAVTKVASKVCDKLKKKSKAAVKGGKSKAQAVEAVFTQLNKIAVKQVKKALAAAKKAVTAAQWKIVTTDLAKLLKFDQYQ